MSLSRSYAPSSFPMNLLDYLQKKLTGLKIHCRWKWHSFVDPRCRAHAKKLLEGNVPLIIRLHSPGVGLFAHLNWMLWISWWAERHGRDLKIECTSPNYASDSAKGDWLRALLQRKSPFSGKHAKILTVKRWEHLPMSMEHDIPFSIKDGRDVLRRHFAICEPLARQLEAFKQKHFRGDFIVGLHYRGTDKIIEAPRIAYKDAVETARRTLRAVASSGVPVVLFVASDEAQFVKHVKAELAEFRVVMVEETLRSANAAPLHQSGGEGLRKAQEALLDALLLGESDVLIKTASGLSGWAPILGKEMPIIILSESFERCACYPDSEIAKHAFVEGKEAEAVAVALTARSESVT